MKKLKAGPYLATFGFSMATWIVLSGRFDAFHLTLGVVSSIIVAALSADILFPHEEITLTPGVILRFTAYLPWLIYQVFLANLHVMRLVFHPRMLDMIDPQIVRFKSRLHKDITHLLLANSITLTPGTITVYVSIYGDYSVHALDRQSGDGVPGEMENRVGRIFGD